MKTGNLDGQGLAQLQNYKFQMLSSAPTSAEAKFYYDTSLHSFRYYNGTEWVDGAKFAAGLGIDATAFANGTIKVDFTEVATATQGGLADSALQPNDNVSELTNDAGYITSSDVGDGVLTIKRNSTTVGTFSANSTSATTLTITVPTTATDVGAVPTSRTVNGKALSSDITLTASDVGALPDSTTIGSANLTIQRNGTGIGTFSANATSATTVNISVPTTATEVGALPSTTTINDLTSSAQQAALNSGVTTSIVTQVGTNATDIGTINEKIPTQASSSNQLADKEFVNSSISTNTANFIGTFDSVSSLEAYAGDVTNNDYAFVVNSVITNNDSDWTTFSALDNYDKTKLTNFDYAWVVNGSNFDLYRFDILSQEWNLRVSDTPKASVTLNTAYNRYKATVSGSSVTWDWEYTLNNSSFTAAQWAAINSGITSTSVTQIATNTSAISGLSSSKQDKLTAGANIQINGTTISATDTVYTLPVAATNTLGGVKVGSNLSIDANGVLSADDQSITVDTTLSTTSTNPVQNKVVTSAIQSNTTAIAAKSSVTFVDWTV